MYTLRVKSHFDAAHFLPWHEGKCKNLHGHRWEVEMAISKGELDDYGVVLDFDYAKKTLKAALPDHTCLNDLIPNPTAELIAREIFQNLDLACSPIWGKKALVSVTVWESPGCGIEYSRPRSEK